MRLPTLAQLASVVLFACAPSTDGPDHVELLLQSTDRVAIYDAGVRAFRTRNFVNARALWRRAADLGDHSAASNLGYLLYNGHGGPADSAEARTYWTRAIEQGDAEAHRHVADAILDGDRHLGDTVDAYAHALAARQLAQLPGELDGRGVAADANRLVARLQPLVSRAEMERGDSLSRSWVRTAAR
jgi:hypothetical protein